jgi:hypothetical protein
MVMRKISFILSLAIFYIPLSFYGAELEKVEVNSLCYYINKETKTAEVTQGQYDKIKKMLDESNGTLEIPSVINVNEANYTITSVGNSAFAEIYYFCVLNLPYCNNSKTSIIMKTKDLSKMAILDRSVIPGDNLIIS